MATNTRATLRRTSCEACWRMYLSRGSEPQSNRDRSWRRASASTMKVTRRASWRSSAGELRTLRGVRRSVRGERRGRRRTGSSPARSGRERRDSSRSRIRRPAALSALLATNRVDTVMFDNAAARSSMRFAAPGLDRCASARARFELAGQPSRDPSAAARTVSVSLTGSRITPHRIHRARRPARPQLRPRRHSAKAQSAFARSRNVNFCTFPVDVFGSGPNTTVRGVL